MYHKRASGAIPINPLHVAYDNLSLSLYPHPSSFNKSQRISCLIGAAGDDIGRIGLFESRENIT